MKVIKKIYSLSLSLNILTVLGLVLAACGEANNTTVSTTTPPSPPSSTTSTTTATTNLAAPTSIAATSSTTTAAPSLAKGEQEISFASGSDTIYGTLELPQGSMSKSPAALLLSGSGPTDRDGNTRLIPGTINSQLNFARVLASQGVVTLRYDKLGSGKTGIGSYTSHPTDVDFNVFVEEARSAYNFLKNRPEVDPQRIMILGHSEGGLIALVLADQLKGADALKALILAAPLSKPYLVTIKEQLTNNYAQAVKAGQVTQSQEDATLSELDQINKSLLQTGTLPVINSPVLKTIYNPATARFLTQVGQYDPAKIAAGLPATLPVLLLCGQKDQQVSCNDVQNLYGGFQQAKNSKASFFQLPNVDHVFKEVQGTPNPSTDYGNSALPFSTDATQKIIEFVKANFSY